MRFPNFASLVKIQPMAGTVNYIISFKILNYVNFK